MKGPEDSPPPPMINQYNRLNDGSKINEGHVFSSVDGAAAAVDGTLAYIRALTAPPLEAPSANELKEALVEPWSCRDVHLPIPVDTSDPITNAHWNQQPKETRMCQGMLDFGSSTSDGHEKRRPQPVMQLQPYLSWGDPSSFAFLPHLDFVHGLKHLLFNTVGSHTTCDNSTVLVSHNRPIFVSTASPYFQQGFFHKNVLQNEVYTEKDARAYVLRCHFERNSHRLLFGCHSFHDPEHFNQLYQVSLKDADWRLKASLVLTNVARIINCLKDYTIPLMQWHDNDKLSLCRHNDGMECVQKIYKSPTICGIFGATVQSMISIYQLLEKANVPHTDRLVSVVTQKDGGTTMTVCKFVPIGRCYLPINAQELLDALGCVVETLLVLHSHQIMHRDIRWGNVFHALDRPNGHDNKQQFTREWVLFDFEFAALAPQPPFGEHSLTPDNHAPEMISTALQSNTGSDNGYHDTAVDVWGLGYLLANAFVDLPMSHASDLLQLQEQCLQKDPAFRPTTRECFEIIRKLQARPLSTEKNVL